MNNIEIKINDNIAHIVLKRGKVNALNENVMDEFYKCFKRLEINSDVRAIILTGSGNFFSFGFDIPEFLSNSKKEFTNFLIKFADFYTYLFLYPKPVIAGLNGHAIAGGYMLALACDYRIIVAGKAKIALNEIAFGSTVFAGATEMLRFCAGNSNAEKVLYSGSMFSANEALALSLIHKAVPKERLIDSAIKKASDLSSKPSSAFSSIKSLLRKPTSEIMVQKEQASIIELVDIWYSKKTWENLQCIKIH